MSYSGISEYLKLQDFGGPDYGPRYQLLQWQPSALSGGVQKVIVPVAKSDNILFIQIEQIQISTDGLGGTISFTHAEIGKNLFNINNAIPINVIPVFSYLIAGNKFTITSNSATVQFSVGYMGISKMQKIK